MSEGSEKKTRPENLPEVWTREAKENMKYQWGYLGELVKATLEEKDKECRVLNNILHHLLMLGDLGESLWNDYESVKVVSFANDLIVREWLDFVYTLLHGGYFGAARNLRWIYESSISASVASINGKILTKDDKDQEQPLNKEEFEDWLEKLDRRKVRLNRKKRKKILKELESKESEIDEIEGNDGLFKRLCKNVHLSKISFEEKFIKIPDLTFDKEEFDKIYELALKTMDMAFYSIIKGYLSTESDGVERFLLNYETFFDESRKKYLSVPESDFPETIRLINESI